MTNENYNQSQNTKQKPTHNICKKNGHGKNVDFETIGVAWQRDDGGLYIRLYGTQIVEGGFYAFAASHNND